jgi:hypothetical protein
MRLSVLERVLILTLLPAEGDITTLRTLRETREAVAFDKDAEECGVVQDEEGVRCTKDWGAEKEIEIPPRVAALISSSLVKLNSEKKLQERLFSLYEKFVGAGE